MEAAATLADLQLRHHPPLNPRSLEPFFPSSTIPMGTALLALETMLSGIRPQPRAARKLNPASRHGFVQAAATAPTLELPACAPVWFPSLGLQFNVAGLENGPRTLATEPATGRPASIANRPVSHANIPSRRAARSLPALGTFELGEERLIVAPVVSPPRLRIHLPKPALNPFRPRYAFAPAPGAEKAGTEPSEEPVVSEVKVVVAPAPAVTEKPVESRPLKATTDHEDRKKQRAGKNGRTPAESNDRKATGPVSKAPGAAEVKKPELKPEPVAIQQAEPEKEKRPEKAPAEKSARAESFAVPSFGGNSDAEPEGFWARMPGWQKTAAALVVIGIAVGAWAVPAISGHNSRTGVLPSSAPSAPASMGADSWQTEPAGDTAGLARRRVISLYKPARSKQDYIFEFSGQIEQRAMGWVFRMKDARNYYCLKLEKKGDGPSATVQLVKFAVVNGEEQPHRLVELRDAPRAGQPFKIRLDVRGQSFSTQVNGRPVDVWIDSQLSSGTVGFSNESGERAVISNVKVSY
jgi:hypothetical protein